jgi:hypothetical protein
VETSWSHTTHHSYTIMTPIDPEIITRRPARIGSLILEIFCLRAGPIFLKHLVVSFTGHTD